MLLWYLISVVTAFEAKYKIKVNELPVAQSAATELSSVVKYNGSYEVLRINNQDTNIVCFLPDVNSIPDPAKEETKRTDDELLNDVLDNFTKLFDAQYCSFTTGLNSGYWTYGYCYGDKIIQFHENPEVYEKTGNHIPELPNHVFVLGRFNGSDSHPPKIRNQSTPKSRIMKKSDYQLIPDPLAIGSNIGTQKALSHTLTDGEICDVTNEPRKINVVYRCDPSINYDLAIFGVNEITTCEYQMIVSVRSLCRYEEFSSISDEKVMDIVCNRVVEHGNNGNLQDMIEYNVPQELPPFPQPKSMKIDLQDYDIVAGGNGFYWGRSKSFDQTSSIYDRRTILIYNGLEVETKKMISSFSKMFIDSMEGKILSPSSESRLFNNKRVITWDDTFVVWYEVYDHKGAFIAVVKVGRDGKLSTKSTNLQWVDPFKMIDQDGDAVSPPIPDPERKLYEYQTFSKGEVDAHLHESTNTVTVTKTLEDTETSDRLASPEPEEDINNQILGLIKQLQDLGVEIQFDGHLNGPFENEVNRIVDEL